MIHNDKHHLEPSYQSYSSHISYDLLMLNFLGRIILIPNAMSLYSIIYSYFFPF